MRVVHDAYFYFIEQGKAENKYDKPQNTEPSRPLKNMDKNKTKISQHEDRDGNDVRQTGPSVGKCVE